MNDKERETYDNQIREVCGLAKEVIDEHREVYKITNLLTGLDDKVTKINTALTGDEFGNTGIVKRLKDAEDGLGNLQNNHKGDVKKTLAVAGGGSIGLTLIIEWLTKVFT